jgi:phosphatidate phosphatase APP1
MKGRAAVKVYHGYGHTHNMHVFGHVFEKLYPHPVKVSGSVFANVTGLLKLFFVEPIPQIHVCLDIEGQQIAGKTEDDGFFKFEWESATHIKAGWHTVQVKALDKDHTILDTAQGEVFIPHITQYGFISDIDDTVLVSHSASTLKRLRELFTKTAGKRELFPDVAEHYRLLANAHTEPATPNPFFYVSSSEWNLYDYLHEVFSSHGLPEGVFLLNQVKRWFELWKTGKTKHYGKLLRVYRVLTAFPKQRFVLLGDNSQSDPEIYKMLVEKFPERIHAVYIRNVNPEKEQKTLSLLNRLTEMGAAVCLFRTSREAIVHSRKIGLIE